MKTLDKYIYWSLIESYIICILLVFAFYIIIDLFSNLDEFKEYSESLKKMQKHIPILWLLVKYYACHLPLIFYNLSPLVSMMASIFTLTRMVRGNEITPLKACGISIYRIFYPCCMFGIATSLLMVFCQEFVITSIAEQIESFGSIKTANLAEKKEVQFRDFMGQMFYIGKYQTSTHRLYDVRVITFHDREEVNPKTVIQAMEGAWINKGKQTAILFKRGTLTNYAKDGSLETIPVALPSDGYILETTLKESHLTLSERKHLEIISSMKLWEMLKINPDFIQGYVTFHARWSFPVSNILLILLGFPWMLRTHTQSFFLGAGICAIIAGAFYCLYIFFLNLGYKEILNPAFSTWFPIVLFGSLGIGFMHIIHT